MTITMTRRILEMAMLSSERIILPQRNLFGMRLTGFVSSDRGRLGYFCCTRIVKTNWGNTNEWFAPFFVRRLTILFRVFSSTLRRVSGMLSPHFGWMIKMNPIFRSCPNFTERARKIARSVLLMAGDLLGPRDLPRLVITGTLGSATRILVRIGVSMVPVVSVGDNTPPKISADASPSSRLAAEKTIALEAQRVADRAVVGPRTFTTLSTKQKADVPLDVPRFR